MSDPHHLIARDDATQYYQAGTYTGIGIIGGGDTITLQSGAVLLCQPQATQAALVIGPDAADPGTLNAIDSGAAVSAPAGEIIIGAAGAGALTLLAAATALSAAAAGNPALSIGDQQTGNGTLDIEGIGSAYTAQGQAIIGNAGSGLLTVKTGGQFDIAAALATMPAILVGASQGSTGSISIEGEFSQLATGANCLEIGGAGTGNAQVIGGATITLGDAAGLSLLLGGASGGAGTLLVDGLGSTLSATGLLQIGLAGTGVMRLDNNATGTAAAIAIGGGALTVTYPSQLDELSIVPRAAGTLTITNASLLDDLGAFTLANGTTTISSNGSLAIAGTLVLAAETSLRVTTAGLLSAGSRITLQGGTLQVDSAGALAMADATLTANAIAIAAGDTIAGAGTLDAAIVNAGQIIVSADATLQITHAISGAGTITLGTGATLQLGDAVAAQQSVVLQSGATLALADGYQFDASISNFAPGDSIDLRDTYADARVYRSGTLSLLNNGGTIKTIPITTAIPGSFALQPDGSGGTIITLSPQSPGDFNGDGDADVLWQNDDGTPVIWLMQGTTITAGIDIGNPGPTWHILQQGDFNGDGTTDLLWQNDDGAVAIWLMQNAAISGAAVLGNPGPTWHPVATADFTGDGMADILWRNDDGAVALWQMQGTSILASEIISNPGPTWFVRGTGVFDSTGQADIVWQNADGATGLWLMQGTAVTGYVGLGNPGPTWHVVATGDFAGDGNTDLLWQNDDGEAAIWFMQGISVISGVALGNPGPAWHILGTEDLNGDGRADIIWQNDDGSVAFWEMQGATIAAGIALNVPTGWHALAGSDQRMLALTSQASLVTGAAPVDFLLAGITPGSHVITGFDPAQDMLQLSTAQFTDQAALSASIQLDAGVTSIAFGNGATLLLPGVAPTQLAAPVIRIS